MKKMFCHEKVFEQIQAHWGHWGGVHPWHPADTHSHTIGHFQNSIYPTMQVFGLWNQHGKNMQTPRLHSLDSNRYPTLAATKTDNFFVNNLFCLKDLPLQ